MAKLPELIIDAHVHPFLDDEGNLEWFFPGGSADDFVRELKRFGTGRCCGSVIKSNQNPDFDFIRDLNRQTLKFRDAYPDFFIPGIHVHPDFPEESCREMEDLVHDENVRWIGELCPYLFGYDDISTKNAITVWKHAAKLGIAVNIHSPADLLQVENVCRTVPDLKLVMAHFGDGKKVMEEHIEAVSRHDNLYLDFSGAGIYRWQIMRRAIDMAGADKFLYGTDFPICNPGSYLGALEFEHLTDDEMTALCSGNFLRLLGE